MTETDKSRRSVRDALQELNLKTRLLEDERDYFTHLNATTSRAYDHHRRELQSLLLAERESFTSAEKLLEDRLRELLSTNKELGDRSDKNREALLLAARQESEKHETEEKERLDRLQDEVRAYHETLMALKRNLAAALSEHDANSADLRTLLQQQEDIRVVLGRHRAAQRALRADRAPKPFVPNGRNNTVVGDYVPSSHNIHALIQTIEHRNFLLPPDGRRILKPTPMDDLCTAILREMMELRLEYHLLTEQLANPYCDAAGTSRRLREVREAIDERKDRLRRVRKSKADLDEDERVRILIRDIVRENDECEKLYTDLLDCIRSSSD